MRTRGPYEPAVVPTVSLQMCSYAWHLPISHQCHRGVHTGNAAGPLRMMLFDAHHDPYRGVICLFQASTACGVPPPTRCASHGGPPLG